jgi:hypothetical protein
MAWTTPRTYVTGEQVTEGILDIDQKANLDALGAHTHSGAAGDGSSSLGSLVKAAFTDASAPSAPSTGLTSIYAVSGRPFYRPNGGASTQLLILADVHSESHSSAHEPSGADTMAVDQAAGVASLRTLGTGSTQIAAGDHSH